MKHLILDQIGSHCKIKGERIQVFEKDILIFEGTLNRLKTICITKKGIGLSSNLLFACAMRGIQLLLIDYTGKSICSLQGGHHRVAKLRENQFDFIQSPEAKLLACQFIIVKLKNQSAVLKYFSKAKGRANHEKASLLTAADKIKNNIQKIQNKKWINRDDWRSTLLGYEGSSANLYWGVVKEVGLVDTSFKGRSPRNSNDLTNSMLNYAYAVISSWVWQAITNAGLELYAGVLHTSKPGKPSLVLDVIEEYRAWCADRIIFKLRSKLRNKTEFTSSLKKTLLRELTELHAKPLPYNKRRIMLESIIQRQVYHLAATFSGSGSYKGYTFKW